MKKLGGLVKWDVVSFYVDLYTFEYKGRVFDCSLLDMDYPWNI